ncbi:glycosyltransferase [Novipirellula sp. SH528]|uniref:glycosyltransferase n=1 Tax=Novipirellula sp. SH528 TaxID=3454466 RepID=UPI003FA03012
MNSDQRRLLFVSYAYPPTGGGGVQRSVKFAKYLPEFRWRPTVLTAANPSVPVRDSDLTNELDSKTPVLRARTLEPSYEAKQRLVNLESSTSFSWKRWVKQRLKSTGMSLLQPDPQTLWNPLAARLARKTLLQIPHQAIYVTGPPFSSFLLGRSLKRRFGLPLVLDFRDEWLLASQYLDNHQRSGRGYRTQVRMLGKVLRAADAVVTTTQASALELSRQVHRSGGLASVHCIYNGYDEDDFTPLHCTTVDQNRLRIIYTGTLWKLTDISPLVAALNELEAIDATAAARIDLIVVGRRTPDQDAIVRRLDETAIQVEHHDYLPHCRSLEVASSADLLLLLLADQPGAERVVPAKLFEYLALRRPILAICGEGETASLLAQTGQTHRFSPDQPASIAQFLSTFLREKPSQPSLDQPVIGQFSRRELTRQLANVVDSVCR